MFPFSIPGAEMKKKQDFQEVLEFPIETVWNLEDRNFNKDLIDFYIICIIEP